MFFVVLISDLFVHESNVELAVRNQLFDGFPDEIRDGGNIRSVGLDEQIAQRSPRAPFGCPERDECERIDAVLQRLKIEISGDAYDICSVLHLFADCDAVFPLRRFVEYLRYFRF